MNRSERAEVARALRAAAAVLAATDPFSGLSPELQEELRGFAVDLMYWMGNTNTFHLKNAGARWRKSRELRDWLREHVNLPSYRLYYGKRLDRDEPAPEVGTRVQRRYPTLHWSTNKEMAEGFAGFHDWQPKYERKRAPRGVVIEARARDKQVIVDLDRFGAVAGRHKQSFSDLVVRADVVNIFAGESWEGEVLTAKIPARVVESRS